MHFFPISNRLMQHFHGKTPTFWKEGFFFTSKIEFNIAFIQIIMNILFLRFHAFMYVDLSLSFFICGKNVLREFAILIIGDQKSRKVNRYQNICNSQNGGRLFSALRKKEPHPKVIIASCATYQLWLKVTIKILPTIFFFPQHGMEHDDDCAVFTRRRKRPTYFGGLLSSDVILTKTPTVTHI